MTGRTEIWQAIQLAVSLVRDEHDVATAQGVLDASGITVPRGRLEDGAWDEQGQLYRLEPWVVSDPGDLVEDEEDVEDDTKDTSGMAVERPTQAVAGATSQGPLKIRCRLSDRGTDLIVPFDRTRKAKALSMAISTEAQVSQRRGMSVCEAYMNFSSLQERQ